MRSYIALLALVALPLTHAIGNPIAVDSERRPATMTSEDVTITVGKEHSTVSGRFSFQQQADDWPEVPDTHVLVYVPVLLSQQTAERYEKQFGPPVVIAEGKRFSSSIRNDLAFENSPESVPLPKGWFMQVFEAEVPLKLLSKSFQIDVSYVQPNFPNSVAGYVPIRPPKDTVHSKVVFTPIEGFGLRPVGFLSALAPRRNQLTFTPQDRKLIAARLSKQ